MKKVVGVNFKPAGRVYYFDSEANDLECGDRVIVDTARGRELGYIVYSDLEVDESELKSPLKPIVRKATESDIHHVMEQEKRKEESLELCRERIADHGLDMKLADVDFTFDNSKIIFYFTADGRVDFRDLVKDLASTFHMRIELRQVGVRDEAKLLGGIGVCGRTLCCHQWMQDFQPVSIKMAKNQNISLNPTKISGICGRLMCCLNYENDTYTCLKEGMPEPGEKIRCDQGVVEVQEVLLMEEAVKGVLVEKKRSRKPRRNRPEDFDEAEEGAILTIKKGDFTILGRRGRHQHRKAGDESSKRQDSHSQEAHSQDSHNHNSRSHGDRSQDKRGQGEDQRSDCDPHGYDECDDKGRSKANYHKPSKADCEKCGCPFKGQHE